MLAKKDYKFHYVYEILELSTNKKYIGKRSCNREPNKDLGHFYFSSSKNKAHYYNGLYFGKNSLGQRFICINDFVTIFLCLIIITFIFINPTV